MKKLFLAVAVLGTVTLFSCKKDHTCTCTTDTGGTTVSASTTINATKSNAEETCESGSATSTVGGTTVTVTCALD